MKTKLIIFAFLLISATTTLAILIMTFPGWERLKEMSPNIIVARCSKTPLQEMDNGIYSDIEVVSVLKGTNSLGPTHLWSFYWPRQGEDYLIFSTYNDGSYQAIEAYRVISLGINFSTNSIAGKTLDEQLQILFQFAYDHLKREIQEDQKQEERLEEGLKEFPSK